MKKMKENAKSPEALYTQVFQRITKEKKENQK